MDRTLESPDTAAWRRHLAFEPEEARALGLPADGSRQLERLAEQVDFYRTLPGTCGPDGTALERLARLAVHRFDRGDDLCNLERSHFPQWIGMPDPGPFLAAQESLLRDGIRAGRTPDPTLVTEFVDSVLPNARGAARTPAARAAWDRHLGMFRDELLPAAARATGNAWALGEDEYRFRLRNMGIEGDPSALGRARLAVVHAQVCERLGVAAFELARDELAAIAAPRPASGAVVAGYRDANRRCVEFVRDRGLFDLPDDFEVPLEPVAAGAEVMTHAGNVPAPLFGDGGGAFQVLDDPDRHPLHWTLPLAVHEGVPGHYLQSWIWQRSFGARPDRAAPAFVSVPDPVAAERHDWGAMLAIEGWAVYAEDLALREGLHDEAGALAVLTFHAIRCVRAIVDFELHAARITTDEGVRMFVEQAGLREADARREVRRSQRVPTQPATYLLGWLRIERLLSDARAAGRSVAEAHADLLALGPVLPPPSAGADNAQQRPPGTGPEP